MVTTEMVVQRLTMFGYVPTPEDTPHIEFELNLILDYVKNYCNITEIPEILDRRIVDRVCGSYLFGKKNSGTLDRKSVV